jgi:molecular chaperone GrpE
MSTYKNKPDHKTENEAGEEIPVTFHNTSAEAVDMDTAAAAKAEATADLDTEAPGFHEADADAASEAASETDENGAEVDLQDEETAAEAVAEEEDPLTAAQQEAADYYDRLLRLSAEFENYKKRSSRELADFRKFANEQIIKDLLGVIDNLERAIASASDQEGNAGSIAEGVELTLKEIFKILEKNGVTVIAAEGETFDPTFHQAVMQQETSDQPPNTVVQELQKGYLLHNRLLRPSMVSVSKAVGG